MRLDDRDIADLRPLIRAVAAEVLAEIREAESMLPPASGDDKPAVYSEDEAAEILRQRKHVLRDLRQRGGISYSRGPRNRVLYTRQDLLNYLAKNHMPAADEAVDLKLRRRA